MGGESWPQGWLVSGTSSSRCSQKGQLLGSLAEPAKGMGCMEVELDVP